MMVLYYVSIFFFLLICGLLSLAILIQESKSMGLGASFGGDAGSSLFGTATADVLKKVTAYLIVIFVVACVFLSLWTSKLSHSRSQAVPLMIEETH